MIRRLQQGMKEDGFEVPMTKLCRWFEVPRRTVYYRPVKSAPKVQERFAAPIKQLIEADPSFGYRSVAGLLRFNKNTVQRIFQIKGWQVRKRAVGHRPRIEALPSVARTPNERWATDLCRVWAGRDGWQTVALVIDCHTRELLGWQLSRSGRATTAMSVVGMPCSAERWRMNSSRSAEKVDMVTFLSCTPSLLPWARASQAKMLKAGRFSSSAT